MSAGADDTVAVLAACVWPIAYRVGQMGLPFKVHNAICYLLSANYTPSKNWMLLPGANVTNAFLKPGFLTTSRRP